MPLEAIRYTDKGDIARFELLDQRRLSRETEYIDVPGPSAAWHAIRVRCWQRDLTHEWAGSLVKA